MKKVLITSFGNFSDYEMNPSKIIMDFLLVDWDFTSKFCIRYLNIPVSYHLVDSFYQNLNELYDLILHLGVASNDQKVRIEILAKNQSSGIDIYQFAAPPVINSLGPKNLKTTVSLDLIDSFQMDYSDEVVLSNDAGAYLCNYIYFKALEKNKAKNILFIHTADPIKNKQAISLERQKELIKIITERILRKS